LLRTSVSAIHETNAPEKAYQTAIATLVNQFGLTATNVHLQNMINTLCRTSFALTLLPAIGLAAVIVAGYTCETTQGK